MELPATIHYPTDFLPVGNEEQMQLIHEFISEMENTLSAKTKKISIADTWKASPPTQAGGETVDKYLDKARPYAIS